MSAPLINNQLIKAGAEVNIVDKKGQTPLHLAVLTNRPEIVHLLLQHGANSFVQDKENKTPLMRAERGNYHECIQALQSRQTV